MQDLAWAVPLALSIFAIILSVSIAIKAKNNLINRRDKVFIPTIDLVSEMAAVPTIDRVSEKVVGFRLDHQGLTTDYSFYSESAFLGSVQTELWKEDNLLLVHRIGASVTGIKQGTAMIDWLVRHSSEIIQPVHVFEGGIGFWIKLKELWPNRINDVDLCCYDYNLLLEKRKHVKHSRKRMQSE